MDLAETCERQKIESGQLTIHSVLDRLEAMPDVGRPQAERAERAPGVLQ